MSDYSAVVLADQPALYWKLGADVSGTTVPDSSGNNRGGKLYTNQAVSASGFTLGQAGGTRQGEQALKINGHWTGGGPTQDFPGTGVRADTYKPFIVGSRITLETWVYKIDPLSFATMFSADGASGAAPNTPHPTLEWGQNADGTQMARWYATVNTYPVGWCDWGDPNANSSPRNEFTLNTWHHIALTFDDVSSLAELWVDGRSQGQLGPNGFNDVPMHFDTLADPGHFQIGWRGNFPDPGNTEVWGGLMQHVAVYERILSNDTIALHWTIGARTLLSGHLLDPTNPAESIEYALSDYFRLDR